jgi:hypothetical protein
LIIDTASLQSFGATSEAHIKMIGTKVHIVFPFPAVITPDVWAGDRDSA